MLSRKQLPKPTVCSLVVEGPSQKELASQLLQSLTTTQRTTTECSNILTSERVVLQKLVYKHNGQFRREKLLTIVKQVNKCLRNSAELQLCDYLSVVMEAFQTSDPVFLPSQEMIHHLLYLMYAESALLSTCSGLCLRAYTLVQQKLQMSHFIPNMLVFAAVLSRIWFTCYWSLKEIVSLYNTLRSNVFPTDTWSAQDCGLKVQDLPPSITDLLPQYGQEEPRNELWSILNKKRSLRDSSVSHLDVSQLSDTLRVDMEGAGETLIIGKELENEKQTVTGMDLEDVGETVSRENCVFSNEIKQSKSDGGLNEEHVSSESHNREDLGVSISRQKSKINRLLGRSNTGGHSNLNANSVKQMNLTPMQVEKKKSKSKLLKRTNKVVQLGRTNDKDLTPSSGENPVGSTLKIKVPLADYCKAVYTDIKVCKKLVKRLSSAPCHVNVNNIKAVFEGVDCRKLLSEVVRQHTGLDNDESQVDRKVLARRAAKRLKKQVDKLLNQRAAVHLQTGNEPSGVKSFKKQKLGEGKKENKKKTMVQLNQVEVLSTVKNNGNKDLHLQLKRKVTTDDILACKKAKIKSRKCKKNNVKKKAR